MNEKRVYLSCMLAAAFAILGAISASSQTVVSGDEFEPTKKQCLDALEGGVVVPFSGADVRWRAEAYAYYRGSVFLIIMQGGTLSCRAWEM